LTQQTDHIAAFGSEFAAFWAHWTALPRTGGLPHIRDYLDSAVPRLQPNVSMMDCLSATAMRVRHMGTAVAEVTGELTGKSSEALYAQNIRAIATQTAWTAASHPCGYTVKRTLTTQKGLAMDMHGLVLPILTDTPDYLCLVAYNDILSFNRNIKRADLPGFKTVIGFSDVTWLDIGAGVPD
jgi:hypothetical protein